MAKPDGRYSLVEAARPPLTNPPPEELRGRVEVRQGKWHLSMPSVVALGLITCVGGFATAWLNKPSPGDPTVIANTIRNEMATQKEERAKADLAIMHRLDGLETQVSRLQDSQDRLRDRVNDRLSKQ